MGLESFFLKTFGKPNHISREDWDKGIDKSEITDKGTRLIEKLQKNIKECEELIYECHLLGIKCDDLIELSNMLEKYKYISVGSTEQDGSSELKLW